MNTSQHDLANLATQILSHPVVTLFLGVLLGHFFTRRTEKIKHLQELRSAAYVDFIRGIATAAQQQGTALVADSRGRIAIYGGEKVVHALSEFIALGAQTRNAEGMQAFAELCIVMRAETGRKRVPFEEIRRVLFS